VTDGQTDGAETRNLVGRSPAPLASESRSGLGRHVGAWKYLLARGSGGVARAALRLRGAPALQWSGGEQSRARSTGGARIHGRAGALRGVQYAGIGSTPSRSG
jgi:hypothetical protein